MSLLFASLALTPPAVNSSESMKLMSPKTIVYTLQEGSHDSGWKSEKLVQIGYWISNRPLGVFINIRGGLNG